MPNTHYWKENISTLPTKTVRITAPISTGLLKWGSSSFSDASILMQNVVAGPPIRNDVRKRDDASWPKTNLPPHRNFWHEEKVYQKIVY